MSGNPFRGEGTLEIGDRSVALVIDINAICMAEEALGMDADAILAKYASVTSTTVVRGLFWAALQRKNPCSLDEAGDIMSDAGFLNAKAALEKVVLLAMPTPDAGGDGGKKNPPKRGRAGTG